MATTGRSRSQDLYERALKVMPGGNSRTTVYRAPYPNYAAYGRGSRVVDVDGVERIDFVNNYTALIHGHAHPEVVQAVTKQLERGACFALPTEAEIELAEIISARLPGSPQVRFANSGSEAVMMAMKAARGFTNRPKIAKCEGAYHGSYDFAEVSQDPSPEQWGNDDPPSLPYSKGTPQGVMENVVVIPFNKTEEAERIIAKHARELACVIIDPVPNRAGLIPASKEFLTMLRRVTRAHGIVLIFDEVITFRLGYRGAQGVFGVDPDLTTLGKIIGGGHPVGAIAGRPEVMAVFDPRKSRLDVPHGGTFNANPVTMVGGSAAMRLMDEAAFARINTLGERARQQIADAFRIAGVPGMVTGMGSLFKLHMRQGTFTDYRSTYQSAAQKKSSLALIEYLVGHGIFLTSQALGSISTVMTDADIDTLAERTLAGLRHVVKQGLVAA